MAFDGCYPRWVREAGVAHRVFIRRARCPRCGTGDALLPDFVLTGRYDSTLAVGAAVLGHAGVDLPAGAAGLYAGVPERTVRSWRQRFAARGEQLWWRFAALNVIWGGEVPLDSSRDPTKVGHALGAIGAVWTTARRRPGSDVPPAWRLANVIFGSQLISTRMDLPWPVVTGAIGRSRGP